MSIAPKQHKETFADYLVRSGLDIPHDTVVFVVNPQIQKFLDTDVYAEVKPTPFENTFIGFKVIIENDSGVCQMGALIERRIGIDDPSTFAFEIKVYIQWPITNELLKVEPIQILVKNGVWDQQWYCNLQITNDAIIKTINAAMSNTLMAIQTMHQKGAIELVEHPRNTRRRIQRKTGKTPSNYYRIISPNKPRKVYASGNKR